MLEYDGVKEPAVADNFYYVFKRVVRDDNDELVTTYLVKLTGKGIHSTYRLLSEASNVCYNLNKDLYGLRRQV